MRSAIIKKASHDEQKNQTTTIQIFVNIFKKIFITRQNSVRWNWNSTHIITCTSLEKIWDQYIKKLGNN